MRTSSFRAMAVISGTLPGADARGAPNRRLEPSQPAPTRTAARAQADDAARQEEDDEDEEHAEHEERLRERGAQDPGQALDRVRAAHRDEPLVGVPVERAAEDGPPERAG